MSETKRTVEGQVCRFCGRLLPLTYFPLKPGMKYARYKACRDCHPLGHSCIPKQKPEPKRRKFATDEERKAAQLEYQRRYREKHRDRKRESTRKSYYRRKGEEPPEEPQKRGPKPKLTEEERIAHRRECSRRWNQEHRDHIREYQRKRYQLKKEQMVAKNAQYQKDHPEVRAKAHAARKAKAEQEAVATERFYCSLCKHIKPAENFITDGKQFKMCNDCREKARSRKAARAKDDIRQRKPKSQHGTSPRVEYHRQYWQQHRDEIKAARVEQAINRERKAKKKEPEDKMCWKCWKWPCFEGIESFETDFAKEGCRSFHIKEDAS